MKNKLKDTFNKSVKSNFNLNKLLVTYAQKFFNNIVKEHSVNKIGMESFQLMNSKSAYSYKYSNFTNRT